MNPYALVYPMFAMVVLSATVLVILFRSRVQAVKEGKVSAKYFRIYQGETEPERTAKASRHFSNLFEAPVLFYAACLAAMITHDTGVVVFCAAWLYVVARVVHSWVHLGGNRLGRRINAYFAGWLVLFAIWVHVVAHAAFNG